MKTAPDTRFWDERRGKIYSRKGGWRIGKGVFSHGYDMMNDLVGQVSYMQVVMLNATGRLPERRLADWVEAVHICLSWPDPRIWCNQIGALSGSAHCSTVAATCAGVMATDSRSYGIRPLVEGVEFIQQAYKDFFNGRSASEIVQEECNRHGGKPYIMGYARPIAKGDERIPAMERVTKSLGYNNGPHLRLAYEIERKLATEFHESMNINGYMSAFLSDQGLTSSEVYRIFSILVASGVTACYVEQFDGVPGSFLPLRCADIVYEGKPPRNLPE